MDGDEHNHASTKPTVNDIARVAGVSLATVDRVLNGRAGVRKVTIDKVNRAVTQLGYVRDTAAANLARRRLYRLLFILPNKTSNAARASSKQTTHHSRKQQRPRTIQFEAFFILSISLPYFPYSPTPLRRYRQPLRHRVLEQANTLLLVPLQHEVRTR